MPTRRYSKFIPPSLSMSELVCQKLDNDATDLLIDKWLERPHCPDAYYDWFQRVRERRHAANANICKEQILLWSKGVFVPENIFTRTVDTGRLIPLDRTWVTHVYHHQSMSRLNMMPVIFSMLPELMLLRGMHDRGCDEIYVIVTDLKRQEMDQVTDYFKYVCRNSANGPCKPSVEEKINHDHMTLTHMLDRNRRTPCFPQIDLTLRAILFEKRPPFVVLFSHQTMSYSQILFANSLFVPSKEVYFDFPSGCPNPGCTDNCCELIRFPKKGLETAAVLCDKRKIDEELMNAAGAFSIDQLMELAGLACAQTLATVYNQEKYPRVLVCCGPGNQGGDGLVAARHLGMFGYKPTIWMPKPGSKDIYQRLKKQCDNMHIQTIVPSTDVQPLRDALARSDVILDAIFGFSFQPPVRAPFDAALPLLTESGVAHREGSRAFKGRHFLGGRFVPKVMEEKFQLNLPEYPGFSQIVELPPAEGSQKL
ncbi:hypothetical protein EVJ58_g1360 [Rhodofomes roseus]|uniref:NAD(P)H-hydrate epimerase n=1 Tax=Rhodofomes roseus TaxID=34475 RepID=A0A4Y9Z1Q4_9APHY|nr:hypothetical protein EVJ58_g1360 [Rhodofomes roseus]